MLSSLWTGHTQVGDFDNILDDIMTDWRFKPSSTPFSLSRRSDLPEHSVKHEAEQVVCNVDLPGVLEGDVDITVDGKRIVVVAKRDSRKISFRFEPGVEYDLAKTEARLANGVLSLVTPRIQGSQLKKIKLLT